MLAGFTLLSISRLVDQAGGMLSVSSIVESPVSMCQLLDLIVVFLVGGIGIQIHGGCCLR
jgi:hypothetical protein